MGIIEAIVWVKDPSIIKVGPIDIRWYGLLFVSGFIIGQKLVKKFFGHEGITDKEIDRMTMFFIVATIVGARLGHCFFYNPSYYLSHPLEILQIWKGGLASHGAAVAIVLAALLYAKKSKKWETQRSFFWVMDKIILVVALSSFFIRTGNLMNSEILGKETTASYGVVFIQNSLNYFNSNTNKEDFKLEEATVSSTGGVISKKDSIGNTHNYQELDLAFQFTPDVKNEKEAIGNAEKLLTDHDWITKNSEDYYQHIQIDYGYKISAKKEADAFVVTATVLGIPRHAAQFYEAISSFCLFVLFVFLVRKQRKNPEGLLLGIFLIGQFTLRFFYEYLKENQSEFIVGKEAPLINMGQILSIPFVVLGIAVLVYSMRKQKTSSETSA